MSLITAEMRAAVGREIGRYVSFPVSESDIRKWAVAVYWPDRPPPHFWDRAAAAGSGHGTIVAPEEFNPFAWMLAEGDEPWIGAGPDHVERLLGLARPGLTHAVNGGLETEYGVRMRPGDVITSVQTLAAYEEHQGRQGPMLFKITDDTWTNQRAELVKRIRLTVIWF